MKKVHILIVTFNRKEYLLKLLKSIQCQSYPIASVLIFDNNSNDGTAEALRKNNYIEIIEEEKLMSKNISKMQIYYYKNSENSGGSGGFYRGLKLSLDIDCDYIWAMDDDVLPEKDCLEKLVKSMENRRICIPNRSDDNYNDWATISLNMNNPFKYNISKRKTKVNPQEIKEPIIDVVDMSFEGPIIEKSLIKEVGLPKKDFFIIFDDSEFAYRINQKTKIGFVKDAILHKQIIPSKDRLMGWKDYYGYRNQYWFDREYGENIFVKKLRPIFNHYELMIKAILKRKFSNIKILKAAYYDGTHNILGKTVKPGKDFSWEKKPIIKK